MILTNKEAVDRLYDGVRTLYEVVSSTMGPRGKNVFFEPNQITHDGVTAARQVELDGVEGIGANLIKKASENQDEEMGDGTTTVTVLTHAIVDEGRRHEPMQLRKDLEDALPGLLTQLDGMGSKSKKDALNAATVAAGDKQIGELAAEVIEKVGVNGAVAIENSEDETTHVEYTPGFTLPFSYTTPREDYKPRIELDNPLVAIFGKSISTNEVAISLMKATQDQGKTALVVFAPNIRGDALQTFFLNTSQGKMTILCVQSVKQFNSDLGLFTGATVMEGVAGMIEADFGSADKVVANKDETTIIGSSGSPEDIEVAAAEYREEGDHRRAGELEGKSAVIRVGGYTSVEREEKKYRIEDAIGSARSAIKGGVVPGCGQALADLDLSDIKGNAASVLVEAKWAPHMKLLENAGLDEETGFVNLLTGEKDKKIVDPLLSVKEALSGAISVGSNILTAGAVVWSEDDSTSK